MGFSTWNPLWGSQIGNLWRTTGDISASYTSMVNNFTSNQTRRTYAGPGHWNDPDMLEIGNAGHDPATGSYSTLAAPANVGDTTVQVTSNATSATNNTPFRIGTRKGGDLESFIMSNRGTAAGAPTPLFPPAKPGDANLKVASTAGMSVGNKLLVDTIGTTGYNFPVGAGPLPDGAFEGPTITSIGTPGTQTALAAKASAGDTNVKLGSVANVEPGDKLAIDDEEATVGSVGTAAAAATQLVAPAEPGDANVKVASVAGLVPGDDIAIDAGGDLETATIASVGTAAGAATTTVAPVFAGDTNPRASARLRDGLEQLHGARGQDALQPLGDGRGAADRRRRHPEHAAAEPRRDLQQGCDRGRPGHARRAFTVANVANQWTLMRPLANGERAVAFFNNAGGDWALASGTFEALGLDPAKAYLAKDLWTKETTKVTDPLTRAFIPLHATVMLRLSDHAPSVTVPEHVTAKSPGATGVAVSYDAHAVDAFGDPLALSCDKPSGSLFPIGPTTVKRSATDLAGRTCSASFVVDVAPPEHPLTVSGTVPATLSLTLGPPASFGAFTAGVAKDYTAQTSASVTSTAGDAALSASSARLSNGAFSLAQPVVVTPDKSSWTGPVSNDAFAIKFTQSIGANEALRTGAYSATLTFTLSTTAP
jgi:Alpha galactosidase C-terminal beta sandwich domain/Alpha galactosidase A/HYR domain